MAKRDYDLMGESGRRAVETGLAAAEWYHTDIPRKQMKELMQRSDGPAIRDTVIWLGVMVAVGRRRHLVLGHLVVRAVLPRLRHALRLLRRLALARGGPRHRLQDALDERRRLPDRQLHGHAQPGDVALEPCAPPHRYDHRRPRPRDRRHAAAGPRSGSILNFFGIIDVWHSMGDLLRNAAGIVSDAEKSFIPEQEWPKAVRAARVHLAIYAATVALALWMGSWLPLMIVGLPRMYGAWHGILTGLLQHGGLADNVTDHRLNSRTVLMNPISRFIYWNMNYHVEHHMFPMVPYHALPRLHELIKHDLPAPNTSFWHGYREMIPAFLRQLRNEDYFLKRELPPTAKPYREEFHDLAVQAAE